MQLQTEPRLYISDWEPTLYIGEWEPTLYIGECEPRLSIGEWEPRLYIGNWEPRLYIGDWEPRLGRGGGGAGGGRGEGDEDYGCVTIKFTWSPHQVLLYSNGPLHQKSFFYSPLPLNSVKRLLMSLCSPEAMWRPPPNKKEIPGLHPTQAKN